MLLLPAVLLAVVLGSDALLARCGGGCPVVVLAVLDEPAHLATAGLALLAALALARVAGVDCSPARATVLTVLAAAVLLDLDHLPLYAGVESVAPPDGRPWTHSLVTVAVLALLARRVRGAGAAALGVGLHLCRDLCTGPGVPLLWPVTAAEVRLPYAVHAGAVVLLAGTATVALVVHRRRSAAYAAG